nr:hypothetical protein [Tanacetum cinerariifolium]
MAWLPMCNELERAVGGRNWLDMMIVYFDEYAFEEREFTRRLNGLIGEMNEAECQLADLVNEGREMVREIEFFVGKLMRDARMDWEPRFIYYCKRSKLDDIRLARQINALCDTLTNVIDERWAFIGELEMLAYKFVPGLMAEFMREIQDKDISNLMKLQILGREFELRVLVYCEWGSVFVSGFEAAQQKMANTCTSLLQELAHAADSDDIRDQLLVLFTREVAEDTDKMENYRQLSGQLRNDVRMRDRYIRELQTSDMSDEVVESTEILKQVQLDDMEKASYFLLMAREIQSKVFKKNTFIARLRD